MDSIASDVIHAIVHADCDDIFAYLGKHQINKTQIVVRAFLPHAHQVELIDYTSKSPVAQMQCIHEAGLYSAVLDSAALDKYKFRVTYDEAVLDLEDPYRFSSTIGEQDIYWWGEGTHEKAYKFLGAHLMEIDGVAGCRFAVWAPNAKRVSVVGDFNHWDGRRSVMRKLIPSGIWEIFVPGIDVGTRYKFEIKARDGNLLPHKADPFGFYAQVPPEQASVVVDVDAYQWQDQDWQKKKYLWTKRDRPMSIYEIHAGSWRRVPEEGNRYLNYRELAEQLIPYVKEMGFTHVQLMPISEFPFDGSWGYQPIGMYAATSRFGSIDDFKYFVDQCHQQDIAVLIDWVPGHFPTDAHGLGLFDGTPLYEHADERQGFHPDWNTFIYNYGRKEVANFLMANAIFWLDQYHIDGLRVDAVASMLYLDYSRDEGAWIPNRYGGRENLEAIDFIRMTNERVYKNFPDAMMVAEESTSWPGVSKPVNFGGLGFGYKWNMGWMNDSLDYISKDPIYRQYHHHDMTFSMYYAFSENFILPLSHDEVVHGKGSILGRMPGDPWQKFANLRAYYGFMWGHPGKKLLFMGSEFGQGPEWDHDSSIHWHQLDVAEHSGVQKLISDLNHLYLAHPEMYECDAEESGFEWIEADDQHNSIFSFIRKTPNTNKHIIFVCNFTPSVHYNYRLGVSKPGTYKQVLNTDSRSYGGSGVENETVIHSSPQSWQYREQSIEISVPPLATVVFELQE
ncbi:1,4-alpha-glucan branching enzyme GlgB [Thalassocella blandensis]|nr:1,4-alpha-glucan branching enzyme GlgB [Thalassocella blandensis]